MGGDEAAMDTQEQPAPAGPQPEAHEEEEYCRFGKRNLDGLSWLFPLVNNRIGDLLNVELRHEQLFFIQGDRINGNIGYSEQGQRFREEEYGRNLKTLADLTPNGYWLVGRRYDSGCMREALAEIDDGAYYTLFSNQCQDWTDRLKREARRIERQRGIKPPVEDDPNDAAERAYSLPVSATAPAAWHLGLITLVAGVLGLLAPVIVANLYLRFLGLVLIVIGLSDIHYAMRAGPRCGVPATILFGLLKAASGVLLLLVDLAALSWAWVLPGAALLVIGILELMAALFSRPHSAWLGVGAAGFLKTVAGLLILAVGPRAEGRSIGLLFSVSLVAAGVSTIVHDRRRPKAASQPGQVES
jgi:uncharacterized membrane protein HdeD (DUF308 family)